ncbi:MAG: SDR family NAD(P)-dependent oxidoreductase [Prolixibacteraceae bacterium]|jgi:3-hydroxy acid dehydrogenase/malonic semialdehyde reductase|nr:SDR family NAD(P)-dependent oxidoreductase [Prolixibacteraceae bacterium]
MKKIALITGATSGIGQATAKLLAKNDFDIIITGRRNSRLEQLEEEIIKSQSSNVYTLNFDVRNKTEVENAINSLPEEWKDITVLINNAGLASGLAPVHEGDYDDWDKMVDTNIKGLLYISRVVSQLMVTNKKGHIINVSSIAGREAYPNGSVYCGSKHAVEAITKSMRLDLLPHNIKVSRISPGMVETEFSLVRFHGNAEKADDVYKGFTPLYAEDVAETILFMVTRPDHVNIDDVLIMPTAQGSARDVFKGNGH